MKAGVKRTYILFGLFIFLSLLHNLMYSLFPTEGGVFFVLGLVTGILFILSMVYTIFICLNGKDAGELWPLGWLGLVGLVGFIPQFGPLFFGLYGFFGFFGLKR
jgi:hypothetical protein